jgi:hypothetical protein
MHPRPDKPGLYWGRYDNYEWFHLIVHIEGNSPFMSFTAWDRSDPKSGKVIVKGNEPKDIIFGPEIAVPT